MANEKISDAELKRTLKKLLKKASNEDLNRMKELVNKKLLNGKKKAK